MAEKYNPQKIEKKWQAVWQYQKTFEVPVEKPEVTKKYILVEFPYPSGAGLHMGHLRPYVAADITARFSRLQGNAVLFPIGWDAFGLPAENYALKTGVHPAVSTQQNINNIITQAQSWGLSFDWSREINTTDPKYYCWTQWLFLQMYNAGLLYENTGMINWCPKDKTGLANEEVIAGNCDRCGSAVEQKEIRQWYFKITAYAEKLLAGLETLPEWPENVKQQQRNWIGKSSGAEFNFVIKTIPETKKHYVFLHGLRSSSSEWFWPKLSARLEQAGHSTQAVELPNPDTPNCAEQLAAVFKAVDFNHDTILVTHSLGGILALKILEKLAETQKRIHSALLIAPPLNYEWADEGKKQLLTNYCNWEFNYSAIQSAVIQKITVIEDVADSQITATKLAAKAELLDAAYVSFKAQQPHFRSQSEPVLLQYAAPAVTVFTTRPDTLFGVTYVTLAPEHELITQLKSQIQNTAEVTQYQGEAQKLSFEQRGSAEQAKTGVPLIGVEVVHPATGEALPVWVSDYVISSYGTGAVMAVPAHDERDFAFAKKFNLPLKTVIKTEPFAGSYLMGADAISDEDLESIGIKIIERMESGSRMVKIPNQSLKSYEGLISAKLSPGFWNEYVGDTIVFIFKNKDGSVEKFILSRDTESTISKKASEFVNTDFTAKRVWNWLSDNEKYNPLLYNASTGVLINSAEFNGEQSTEAGKQIAKKFGQLKTTYKMRDWVFSRQRYWGEPIPLIHCAECGVVPVPDEQLPVLLPETNNYQPSDSGESPLATIPDWVQATCPQCAGPGKRETNTMPQWAGSCWYYLRYIDPQNTAEFANQALLKEWLPVDLYFGGYEHTTLHLLYSRFWHLVLFDLGLVPTPEPYTERVTHGIILGPDGDKMSKSKGNVVNPDDFVLMYGADTVRMYEMFLGPHGDMVAWNDQGIVGVRRFLERFWNMVTAQPAGVESGTQVQRAVHTLVHKVTHDLQIFSFNTSVAAFMSCLNDIKNQAVGETELKMLLIALNPFAPHITEELWSLKNYSDFVNAAPWPKVDFSFITQDVATYAVQVNGKMRAQLEIGVSATKDEVLARAQALPEVKKFMVSEPRKTIFVPGKIVNFVI